MLGIPRRYSHFVFGVIQIRPDIGNCSRNRQPAAPDRRAIRHALAAVMAGFLAPDVAGRNFCGSGDPPFGLHRHPRISRPVPILVTFDVSDRTDRLPG